LAALVLCSFLGGRTEVSVRRVGAKYLQAHAVVEKKIRDVLLEEGVKEDRGHGQVN
jgi:hypothetical protein